MVRALLALSLACFVLPAPAQTRTPLRDGWTFARGTLAARPADAAFAPIAVPGTFEAALGAEFDGGGWYRRTLDLRALAPYRHLEFTAVATEAVVFVNGVQVARHLGGWTPFLARLAGARADGVDLLDVFVDEKVGHNTQGFHPIIQPHFGGIWQDVWLCAYDGPSLDRTGLMVFGDADILHVEAPILRAGDGVEPVELRITVRDGARVVTTLRQDVLPGKTAMSRTGCGADRRWSPRHPHLYPIELELRRGEQILDQVVSRVGFRDLRADGRRLLLDGEPLQVRGVLHWGYEPPLFAPNPDPSVWRRELEDLRARGFNMVKACLWVPPRAFFEIADEIGMLVWQEYPTWHPTLTPEHRDALVSEFGEFFRHDRSHVCVPFRSLTCETGHSADLTVIQGLYDAAHEAIRQTLVVDDSSWIEWLRVYDFFDDHPYGNNSWWPGKLAHFEKFIAAREPKPLLLGECIAADTWVDLAAWRQAHPGDRPWWAPRCIDDQPRFEAWVAMEFGPATLAALRPDSLAFAMRMRKYQIERLRLDLPAAGYTVSVLRDFTLARMGLYDDLGAMKWPEADWAWHGDTMLCLDAPRDARAFVGPLQFGVRVAHAGPGACAGRVEVVVGDGAETFGRTVAVASGEVSTPIAVRAKVEVNAPTRLRVQATLSGSHAAANHWDVWALPKAPPTEQGDVRIVKTLDAAILAFLRDGGRVLHLCGDRARSLKTDGMWMLRGATFTPPHPLHARVPAELLQELSTFDLESGRVIPWANLVDQVDPVLAFWETHDIPTVRAHLLAFDCRVGSGRLLATALNHDTDAGQWLLGEFVRHLREGRAPQRALAPATVEALAAFLGNAVVDLPEWELRTDPKDEGLALGFAKGGPADGWRKVNTKSHWESQGFRHYDGVAWYRTTVEVPADWKGRTVSAVFEGVDDSFRLYVGGQEVARFGNPETKETVWLQRVTADVTRFLTPGTQAQIVLRVVDHNGAGGIWKPVFLTTGPVDARSDLLH